MEEQFFVEVRAVQKNHDEERICGDTFLSKRILEENRIIAVLSDGMGHGVKANVLSTLTATMALKFTEEYKDFRKIAEIIMNTLPECSERKISYSTFTIIDINFDGETQILEYDNPRTFIVRNKKLFDPNWETIVLESEKNYGKKLHLCKFKHQKEDRIISTSDGVTQSGMGSEKYPFGWTEENVQEYVLKLVSSDTTISASQLANKIVNMAVLNGRYKLKDDTSCLVTYYREPRKLLLSTGPPYEKVNDVRLGNIIKDFEGKKIVCGATTSDIVARELGVEIVDSFEFEDDELPPISYMPGIDLVTEGILTLSKVSDILNNYSPQYRIGKGPADLIVKMFIESDEIHFVIGTRINIAHQDPNLPIDLEIRRTVVRRIAKTLETKFLKQVFIQFI
ncbi:MAG: SpoIIE family protein phosphatase [Lentimicrobiaceae bacterium]|nr:SpoIIE family protein phosphatase [Lentimicrobiaceae bacterium]